MFYATYKNTFKSLFRSVLFYLSLVLLIGVAIYEAIGGGYGYYDMELQEVIMDTDPRFVLNHETYLSNPNNACCANMMMYAMPLFAVISAVLVLHSNYNDRFYEIEKAGNVKSVTYFMARILALITINAVLIAFTSLLTHYWYVFSRGGVDGMGTMEMLLDSFVRVMRYVVFLAIPSLTFYITFTYAISSIFKSGWVGAIAGMGHVVAYFMGYLMLRLQVGEIGKFYFNYLSPIPNRLRDFLYSFDTADAALMQEITETSLGKATTCIGVLLGISFIYSAISLLLQRKRIQ